MKIISGVFLFFISFLFINVKIIFVQFIVFQFVVIVLITLFHFVGNFLGVGILFLIES